jgi:hypothetical protein
MMLGFIGMEALYVGLQRGQVTKLFWTVRTPEWLGIFSLQLAAIIIIS